MLLLLLLPATTSSLMWSSAYSIASVKLTR